MMVGEFDIYVFVAMFIVGMLLAVFVLQLLQPSNIWHRTSPQYEKWQVKRLAILEVLLQLAIGLFFYRMLIQ